MVVSNDKVDTIVKAIGGQFRVFGGGEVRAANNPVAHVLKDKPMQFAGGVDVEQVVRAVLAQV